MVRDTLLFVFNSIMLGVGLAMDAFSVSIVNGISEEKAGSRNICGISDGHAYDRMVSGTYSVKPVQQFGGLYTVDSSCTSFVPRRQDDHRGDKGRL